MKSTEDNLLTQVREKPKRTSGLLDLILTNMEELAWDVATGLGTIQTVTPAEREEETGSKTKSSELKRV